MRLSEPRIREEGHLLSSDEVVQFIEAALAFCETIDEIGSLSKIEFLVQVEERLPLVYSRGTRLDWPWGCYEGEEDDVLLSDVTIELPYGGMIPWWSHLIEVIGLKLGWQRLFHGVWDPVSPNDSEVGAADLARLLAQIYTGLKQGLLLYERGSREDRTQALWNWKFGMKLDWGSYTAEAMLPIHRLIHLHYDEDDEVFEI